MDRRPAARLLIALALVAGAIGPVLARDAARLEGAVRHPLVLDAATLRALPKTVVGVDFSTSHGREEGRYEGALLWALLEKASLEGGAGKNAYLRRILLVTGRDGYVVALAVGELDPHYEGKTVILAYAGGPVGTSMDALRLIVPGDAHGGRNVRDVVHIEVK